MDKISSFYLNIFVLEIFHFHANIFSRHQYCLYVDERSPSQDSSHLHSKIPFPGDFSPTYASTDILNLCSRSLGMKDLQYNKFYNEDSSAYRHLQQERPHCDSLHSRPSELHQGDIMSTWLPEMYGDKRSPQ